jgi:hypothetical protein
MWWRKIFRWWSVNRLGLVILLGTWWFVLQRDVRVINAVDAMSYLAAVYSAWRGAGATLRAGRSLWGRIRRGEVAEGRKDLGTVGVGGQPAEGAQQDGVARRQDDRSR